MRILLGVQYLRAFAALLVLYFHASVNAGASLRFGECGVDVFFVISGFLMWAVTDENSVAGSFLANRARRIIPVYWVATTVVLISAISGLTGRIQPDFAAYLKSLTFVPYQGPTGLYPMLNVGWTLNYEMFFYAVFASLIGLSRRVMPWALSGIFGVLALVGLAEPQSVVLRFYTNPIILEFVAGVWLAVFVERTPSRLTGALLLVLGIVGLFSGDDLPRVIGYGIPAIACVWGMLAIERSGGVPPIPLARLAGDASYSIYIWHTFGIALVAQALKPLPFATVGLFFVGLAFGLAGYYAIERPVLNWTRSRRTVAAAS